MVPFTLVKAECGELYESNRNCLLVRVCIHTVSVCFILVMYSVRVCSLGWCVNSYMSTCVCVLCISFSSCMRGNAAFNLHPLHDRQTGTAHHMSQQKSIYLSSAYIWKGNPSQRKVIKRGSKTGNKIANLLKT